LTSAHPVQQARDLSVLMEPSCNQLRGGGSDQISKLHRRRQLNKGHYCRPTVVADDGDDAAEESDNGDCGDEDKDVEPQAKSYPKE
jgi:hypothetical protein